MVWRHVYACPRHVFYGIYRETFFVQLPFKCCEMHTDSEAAESAKLNVLRQGVAKIHCFLYSSIWLNFVKF